MHGFRDAWSRLGTDAARFVRRQSFAALACLAAIVALGAALRLQSLDQPMRFDESYTYLFYASRSWLQIVSDYSAPNNHIFNTLLIHLCVMVWGNAPAVLRLPSLVAGIAILPATYVAARCFLDEAGSLLATGLASTSTALTLYATNARGYSLVCLCFLVLLALAQYLARRRNAAAWGLFVLFAIVGLYTIPIMVYPLSAALLWLLVRGASLRPAGAARRALVFDLVIMVSAIGLIAALLYLPVLLHDGPGALVDNANVQAQNGHAFLIACSSLLRTLLEMGLVEYGLAGGLFALAAMLIPLVSPAPGQRELRTAALLIVGWCVLVMVVSRRPPFPRVWLFLVPLLALLAGGGTVSLLHSVLARRRHARLLIAGTVAAIIAALGCYAAVNQPATRAVEPDAFHAGPAVTADFARLLRPGDCVLSAVPENAPLAYYFLRAGISSSYVDFPRCVRRRLFVVVNQEAQHMLNAELTVYGIDAARYREAEVVRRYPGTTLYLLLPAPAAVRPAH